MCESETNLQTKKLLNKEKKKNKNFELSNQILTQFFV